MTRFARTAGSKSTSRRVPEDPTPWNQLKNPSSSSQTPKKIVWKRQESVTDNSDFTDSKDSFESNTKAVYKRRKPLTDVPSFFKGNEEIRIARFEGFPVRKQDADRLKELRKKLLQSKVSPIEVRKTLKLERRRAEKALARDRKKLCFHCRKCGHILSECPELGKNSEQLPESGICFKCGSTEHQHTQCKTVRGDVYKYATCFICKEEGHVSKQCPDNPRGLYPEGGGCRVCGDVTHLKKDCPKFRKRKKDEFEVTIDISNKETLDALDEDLRPTIASRPSSKKKKIVKM